jgi:hypothetical protein
MNILEQKIDTLTQIVIDCCIEKNNSKSYISQTPYTKLSTVKKKKRKFKRKPSSRSSVSVMSNYLDTDLTRTQRGRRPVIPTAHPLQNSIPLAEAVSVPGELAGIPIAKLVAGGKRKRKTKKRKYRKRKRKTKKRKYRKRK